MSEHCYDNNDERRLHRLARCHECALDAERDEHRDAEGRQQEFNPGTPPWSGGGVTEDRHQQREYGSHEQARTEPEPKNAGGRIRLRIRA